MGRRRWYRMPPEVRREVMRLAAKGHTYQEIIERVDISEGGISCVLRPLGGVIGKEALSRPSAAAFDRGETVDMAGPAGQAIAAGHRLRAEAGSLPGGEGGGGQPRPPQLPAPPGPRKGPPAGQEAYLKKLWSPQQIAARLRSDFGDDKGMNVSHETIYKSVYVQGRGQLRKELARCLRTGRATRKHQGRLEKRGSIADMVMISERPAEVEDRAVPGHWKGDLLMGADNQSAIGTLVERATRFVMLLHLPGGHGASEVSRAMAAKIGTLPTALRRSITWDQGREMVDHLSFRIQMGVEVYFCDPHSPWQRGSNENTDGLLRQYFPKGTDLSQLTEADLDAAADSLNGRPRQTLGWMTPSEKLAEFLVASTG